MGRTEPRLSTGPAVTGPPGPCGCGCALTERTSLGFELDEFARTILGVELLPWQRWWAIHALELDGSGGYRFRTVLTLVSRQNGKTHLLKILALWAMYMGRVRLVLGVAQSLDISRESWQGAVDLAEADPEMRAEIDAVRRTNGEQTLSLTSGARYRIAAATRSAGRGLSVDLLILDELREHRDWLAWGALSKTTMARPHALTVGISNAGDDQSVVLNSLRGAALAGTDPALAVFEWSAEDDAALDDPQAWAQANPGLGRTISETALRSAMATDPPNVFRTELLCQRVDSLDSAVDLGAWRASADPGVSLAGYRDRIVVGFDVAPDGASATLAGVAVTDDGRVIAELLASWVSTEDARHELPELLAKVAPVAVAWFPTGPAAALAAELRSDTATELRGAAVQEACMAFTDLVAARRVTHPSDARLDAHVAGASKLVSGDGYRFTRRGVGHCDALYALAGAAHVARTRPVETPLPRPMVV
jgi:hypothetical protein